MNTKEFAKLLLKHPLIKKINESQIWDKSIVSRVIAEELLNEQDKIQARIDKLEKRITNIQADVETNRTLQAGAATQKEKDDYAKQIEADNSRIDTIEKRIENLKAKQNDAPAQKELEKEVPEPAPRETTSAEKELSRDELVYEIDTINSTLANFKKETPLTRDLKKQLSAAQEKLNAMDKTSKVVTDKAIESDKPEDKKVAKAVNQETAKKAAQAKKKVEATKESPPKVKAVEIAKAIEEIPTEPLKKAAEKIIKSEPQPEPEEPKQLPSKGWVNPFSSLKRQIAKKAKEAENAQVFLDSVLDALGERNQANFFKLVAPRADAKPEKFKQALQVIEDTGAVQEFQSIIDSFKKQEPEVAVDQVMSYLGFLEELSKIKSETERFGELVKGLTKQVAEKPEAPVEQTAKDFLQTNSPKIMMRAEFLNAADQYSKTYNLQDSELLKNELFKIYVGALLRDPNVSFSLSEQDGELMIPQSLESVISKEEMLDLKKLYSSKRKEIDKFLKDLAKNKSEEKGFEKRSKEYDPSIPPEEKQPALPGPVQEEGAQEEAQEDIQPERETPPQVFSEQHYTTLATFFADEGARGLGFMQQLLLRRQSEQLYGLIETLNELIDPTGGEEAALTREVLGEQQEESTTEQGMELEPSEKRKLKSELLGLLSALRSLKTLSKAYEENLTRTSVDPRYDGSSLKKRLDAMLPDIQDSIARILKMIKDFLVELPKVEPMGSEEVVQEQEGRGLDREAKIDLVDDTYKEMRKMWPVLKSALQEQTEKPEGGNIEEQEDASKATETVVSTAREMRELASSKPFIDFFPTITFSQEGQVVSINQANNVLSGVISQFVYVMRNVVALVKGEELTEGTAIEVQDKLVSISNAIEKSFGVPASKVVRQVEKEISENPSDQSLTDTPANNNEFFNDDGSMEEPEGDLELDDEDEEPDTPISTGDVPESLQSLVKPEMLTKMETLQVEKDKQALGFYFGFLMKLIGEKPQPEEMLGEFVDRILVATRVKTALKDNDIDYSLQVGEVTGLMRAEETLKGLLEDEKFRIDKHLDSFLGDLTEDNKEEVENILSKILKKVEPKREPIEEALKPIIAKMLKEHHG